MICLKSYIYVNGSTEPNIYIHDMAHIQVSKCTVNVNKTYTQTFMIV